MARARSPRTDLVGRLADLSEDALQRLADAPGAERVTKSLNMLRDRMDELQKRVRGLEELERRLTALERKVDKLAKGSSSSTTKRAGARATSTRTTKSSGGSRAKKS